MKFLIIVFLCFAFSGNVKSIKADNSSCNFSAIFNFGDSNSDTSSVYAYFHNIHWPNGITVGKVFKRSGDGRLIIDFLAETLGFPYLNASGDTNGTTFRYGANFAVGGSFINPGSGTTNKSTPYYYHLDEQVSLFFDFKSRAIASSNESEAANIYPKAEAFAEALYTIDIGQNDVSWFFFQKPVSNTLDYFTKSVQRLLNDGAKYLWVHKTCPFGCLPYNVGTRRPGIPFTPDIIGCGVELNEWSQNFNSELKLRIDLWRKQYPAAVITLVDMYSAKYNLVANPQVAGFDSALKFKYCCVNNIGGLCGDPNTTACTDPSKYLTWDSIHWTEAANRILANQIANGSFSEPRVGLLNACKREY